MQMVGTALALMIGRIDCNFIDLQICAEYHNFFRDLKAMICWSIQLFRIEKKSVLIGAYPK